MVVEHWQTLIGNLAITALIISAWTRVEYVFNSYPRIWRQVAFGVAMGLGAVASMWMAIQINGSLFDLRQSLLVLASAFGGVAAAVIAATIAILYRVLVVGGPTAVTAIVGICAAALVGLAATAVTRARTPGWVETAVLASASIATSLAVSAIFRRTADPAAIALTLPVALMNGAAIAISASFLMRYRTIERERDLLRAAFIESPDFQYVKLPNSRFALVNKRVSNYHGYGSPEEVVGKSDFDLTDPDRAQKLMDAEQEVMQTGKPLIGLEEKLVDEAGHESWFSSSKVALHDGDDEVIGLAGVTRDITARKLLEQEVVMSRNRLDYVLESVDDGIAMFDRYGVLLYCNDPYRDMFPLTRDVRRPGRTIRDILRAAAMTGEERGVPAGKEDEWVETVAATLHTGDDQEINLKDGRWMHIRSRPTADGTALVVITDITKMKQTESALVSLTEQLKALATTDGLTGLVNRRGFDAALETEIARSRRQKEPMSLLLIDADRFKAYNDLYGHQAGDEVLKAVADCLRQALKRPGDVAARYGGEEFAAILPNTDEDGAFFIADTFREALKALALPHRGAGNKGVVSASIGIAVFDERDLGLGSAELLRRADEALYNAKGAGRDRITGWRPRPAIRPVGGMRA